MENKDKIKQVSKKRKKTPRKYLHRERLERKDDYMKYWRVIRYYILKKYKLSTSELDMMMFLYSEKYFNREKFDEFDNLLSWDEKRFSQLITKKWIEIFRKKAGDKATIYRLSNKGSLVISDMYKRLNGEAISETKANPIMVRNSNTPYTNKIYSNMIKKMNKFAREERIQVERNGYVNQIKNKNE
tara:strand:- start:3459 stop:4016 length:558 start_codon:yes stop_codon:yes gene_type:complete